MNPKQNNHPNHFGRSVHAACRLLLLLVFLVLEISMQSQCIADAGNDTTICVGTSLTLGGNPTAIDASVGVTYLWTSIEAVSDNTVANPTVLLSNTGVYSFSVTLSSGGCDEQSDIMLVNVVNPPVANFTFSPNNACANVPVAFTNTSSGCANCSYEWNFGDGTLLSTQENPTHTFLTALGSVNEIFTVELTAFENGGCSSNQSFDVTVQQIPDISLTDPVTDFTNCTGEPTFSLSVSEELAPANVTQFNIDWGDGTADWMSASAPNNESHIYLGNDIWNLTYSAIGSNGCTATLIYEVTNISSPVIGVGNLGGTQGCAPLSICFELSNYSFNHPSTFYVVDYGDATPFDTLNHPPPDEICHEYDISNCPVNPSGFTFTVTAVNNCSETTSSIFPIRIYTAPQAAFDSGSNLGCVNSTVNFTNNSIPGYNNVCSQATTYTWNFGDGSPDVVVINTGTQSHFYDLPGNYTVSLTASNACGNTSNLQGVCIEPQLTAAFTLDNNDGCVPLVVNTSNNTDLNQSCAETVEWLVDYAQLPCSPAEGIYSFLGTTNASSSEPQISLETGGTFDITLRVSNACGITEQTETVTVNTAPTVEVITPSSICINTPANATASADGCNLPILAYLWTFPGGVPASANTLIPPDITYSAAGNYTATLTVTNACGSTGDNGLMPVFPEPDVQISSSDVDLNVCSGSNTTLTATGAASYSWSPEDYLNTTSGNEVISSPTAPVTYTVTGISGSCSDSETITLNITSSPTISAVEPFYEKCADESVQLEVLAEGGSGVYDSYQWQPDLFLSDNAIPNPICSATDSTTYQAFVIDSNGCIAFTEVPVFVNPSPTTNAGPDISLCNQPVPTALTGYSPTTGGSGVWIGPNVTTAGVFTPSGVGVTNLTYCFTNATTGCSACDDMNVTVINPITANAGPDIEICLDAPSVNLAVGGTWSTLSGVSLTPSGVLTPDLPGTHELLYTTGTGSCESTDIMNVTVHDLPSIDAGVDVTICEGETAQLNSFQSNGEAPYDVIWTFPSLLSAFDIASPLAFPSGTTTFTAVVIDANGCTDSDAVTVFVNGVPLVNAGPDAVFCNQPIEEVLTGFSPATGAAGTGEWSGPGISDPSGEFTSPGIGNYWLFYEFTSSGTNCSAVDSIQVSVIPAPLITAGSDVTACFNEGVLQLTGFSPAAGGVWSGPGVVDGIIGTIEPEEAGVGSHVLTFEFGSGSCLSTDDIILDVLPLPLVNAGPGASACEDDPTFVLEGFSPATGGIWEGFGIVDPQIGSFNPVVGAGDYEVFYRIEDLTTGCADTAFTTVNILPLPNASFVIPVQTCSLVPIDIQNLSSGAAIYNWDFGNSDTSTDSDPVYAYPASDEGQNTISLTVTSVDGCTDFLAQNVEVVNAPVALFETNLQSGCSPLEITFANSSSGTDNIYSWDFGNDTGSDLESPDPVIYTSDDEAGFFDIALLAQNLCGDDDTTVTITVFPNNSEAYFDENVNEICLNLHIGLALDLDEPENFDWSVSVFSENANVLVDAPLEVHSNSDEYFNQPAGNYQLVISTSYEGCSDSSEGIPVNFSYCSEANVFLPKCFTPNGDGTNDLLTPAIWGIEENSYEFIVTNRERNIVFRSTTVGEGWDGSTPNDNLEAQIGVYFYQVLYVPSDPTAACAAVKDGKCEKLGHVTIVR